ncbi:hypothetical protein H9645_04540 [Luteimonas sp. Sa2BVA3]|uniref:Uncharacterized protein n=1 Tax=Luteimonas colneyensis TaxID=2762230 RepID=A0ABR8UGY5_9GAMM|nr:hypothetical protein [Luteimonas colneyensis]MBD7987290.1 hypothetical protein [Luteimonas colneyensis]
MLLEFIAILAAGFGLAGLVLSLNIALRRRLPQWVVPASAGAGMLLMAIWLEYSWLDRTTGTFPDGVEVASTNQSRSWYRPWTYVVPLTNRLIAVDHRFDRRHADMPGQVLTRVILAGRWEPTRQYGVVYDCTAHRRADLLDQVQLDEAGRLRNASWIQLAADDPVLRNACGR